MYALIRSEAYLQQLALLKYPYTNVLGLSRSLLALGLFLTLLFTPIEYIVTSLTDGTLLNPLLNPRIPLNNYNFFLLFGLEQAGTMKIVAMAVLLLVISGYFPQLTCWLHWWVALSFMLCSSAIDGGDQIHANLALLLIPLCLTDPRRNHWHNPDLRRKSPLNFIGIFSVWMVRLQMAVIYFHASVGKYEVPEWSNGTAIYYWFYHSVFGMPKYLEPITLPFLQNSFLVAALTYSVLVFEIVLAAALLMAPKKRRILLVFAISFHFFIVLYHGIFSFFFSVAAGLIIYLGNPAYSFNPKAMLQRILPSRPAIAPAPLPAVAKKA